MKNEFKKWLKKIGMSQSAQSNYILYIDKYIPDILQTINIEVGSLFDIKDSKKLENILDTFQEKDELQEINLEKNHYPVSSLKKYIEFFKSQNKKDINMKTKNIMLYGAPGVGKTFNCKKLVALIEGANFTESEIFDFVINNKNDQIQEGSIDELYKTIKNEKRIEFVTFHQNYSYEDFVEGFRPNENGSIELDKKGGIFKRIADNARKNLENSQINEDGKQLDLDELIQKFTNYVQDSLDKEEKFFIDLKLL